jgi:hypothetical protein
MASGAKAGTWSLASPFSQGANGLNAARRMWVLKVNLSEGKHPNSMKMNLMLSAVFSK